MFRRGSYGPVGLYGVGPLQPFHGLELAHEGFSLAGFRPHLLAAVLTVHIIVVVSILASLENDNLGRRVEAVEVGEVDGAETALS